LKKELEKNYCQSKKSLVKAGISVATQPDKNDGFKMTFNFF